LSALDEPRPAAPQAPAPPAAPAAPKPSSWGLALRVASGALFVPILIVLAQVGGRPFLAFVMLQVGLAITEFYRMMRAKGLSPYAVLGTLSALVLQWVCFRPRTSEVDLLATAALLLVLAFGLRRAQVPRQAESMAVTVFGVLYVGWLSAHLVLLRELPWRAGTSYAEGSAYVLLAFFVTWSCDTGAFLIGRLFGRIRPWTRISPRKSIEGSAGGFAFAIAAAFVARAWFAPFLGPADAAALGVLVGIAAQVGDLVESLFKRDARHGDSSDLIPGHGGVLDRFDSLYFAAPVVFYYLKLAVYQVP
jgi:phosphatidate cytidylyltransferase